MSPVHGSFDTNRYHKSPPTPDSHAGGYKYRGIILENLNASTQRADLENLLQTAGTVQQIHVTKNQGQTQGLATMQTVDRRESFDSSDADSDFEKESRSGTFTPVKAGHVDICKPLVVDGSGHASRLETLSTSAPT
jgi:hypothetical protein